MTGRRGRTVLMAALTLGVTVHVNAASSRVAPDRVAPRVTITSPRSGATVGGAIRIAGVARDNRRVTAVAVRVDGGRFRRAHGTRAWSLPVQTRQYRDGIHTLTVRARDRAGNSRRARIRLTFSKADTQTPRVSVDGPPAGASLRGKITVMGKASDDGRVVAVEVRVDEGPYWTAGGTGVWLTTIDTTAYLDGNHTIIVRATDAAGNKAWARQAVTFRNGRGGVYWGAWVRGATYNHLYGGTWNDVPWDANTWNRFESNAGKRMSIVHWGVTPPWANDFNASKRPFDLVHGRGAINLVDMDTRRVPLRDVARGRYDAAYTTWARQAKAWGHPWFLRWNAEMNGSWNAWGTTPSNMNRPADFVAAWRHVHDIFTRVGATNVTWVWCPNIEYSATVPYEQLYPGDGFVDWTCLDGYNKATQADTFANLFSRSYRHLLQIAPSKPIMIGETASIEYGTGQKAAWVTDMLLTQLPKFFPRIKAIVWFNWRFQEGSVWGNYQIESSSTAQKAFRDGIASSYYLPGRTLSALPVLRPVPEP